jgi:hypothetical protein
VNSNGDLTRTNCKVCGRDSDRFDDAVVLGKYSVRYFRCTACGFMQTERPYWLDEAYSSAITRLDVGILQRNLVNRELSAAILNLLGISTQDAVDFGGGHGIFVRLMRDEGFDFYWCDQHASNDYARGFEHTAGRRYSFATAFEVLEHLPDPVGDLSKILALAPNLLVSTTVIPQVPPRIRDWWYYGPSTGQHVSLYTLRSLELLAKQSGRFLLSNGHYHLFTETPQSSLRFALGTRRKIARLVNLLHPRRSLLDQDFQRMVV